MRRGPPTDRRYGSGVALLPLTDCSRIMVWKLQAAPLPAEPQSKDCWSFFRQKLAEFLCSALKPAAVCHSNVRVGKEVVRSSSRTPARGKSPLHNTCLLTGDGPTSLQSPLPPETVSGGPGLTATISAPKFLPQSKAVVKQLLPRFYDLSCHSR